MAEGSSAGPVARTGEPRSALLNPRLVHPRPVEPSAPEPSFGSPWHGGADATAPVAIGPIGARQDPWPQLPAPIADSTRASRAQADARDSATANRADAGARTPAADANDGDLRWPSLRLASLRDDLADPSTLDDRAARRAERAVFLRSEQEHWA